MKKVALLTAGLFFVFTSAMAGEEKRIVDSFASTNLTKITVDVPVGAIHVSAYDGDKIEVSIIIEPKSEKDMGWFASKVDLSKVELESKNKKDTLYLTVDEDDVNQTWTVKIPAQLAANIDLGVGEVTVDNFSQSLNIDIGVGAAEIDLVSSNYHRIELEAGVGDTRIRGFNGEHSSRSHLVGSNSKLSGSGEHEIRVNVGVGDVKVTQ